MNHEIFALAYAEDAAFLGEKRLLQEYEFNMLEFF